MVLAILEQIINSCCTNIYLASILAGKYIPFKAEQPKTEEPEKKTKPWEDQQRITRLV
jgi:hypothetical protein